VAAAVRGGGAGELLVSDLEASGSNDQRGDHPGKDGGVRTFLHYVTGCCGSIGGYEAANLAFGHTPPRSWSYVAVLSGLSLAAALGEMYLNWREERRL
jgi:hypothetical protein